MSKKNIFRCLPFLSAIIFVSNIVRAQAPSDWQYADYGSYVSRDNAYMNNTDPSTFLFYQEKMINHRGPHDQGIKSIVIPYSDTHFSDECSTAYYAGYYPIIGDIGGTTVNTMSNTDLYGIIDNMKAAGVDWILIDDAFCSTYSWNEVKEDFIPHNVNLTKDRIRDIAAHIHSLSPTRRGNQMLLATSEWTNTALFDDTETYIAGFEAGQDKYQWWDPVDIIMPYAYAYDVIGVHPNYDNSLWNNVPSDQENNKYLGYVQNMRNWLKKFRDHQPSKMLIPWLAYGNQGYSSGDMTWYDQLTSELIVDGIKEYLVSSFNAGQAAIPANKLTKPLIMLMLCYELNDQEEDAIRKLQGNYGLGWGGISIWTDNGTSSSLPATITVNSYLQINSDPLINSEPTQYLPYTYTWYLNGNVVPGCISSTYSPTLSLESNEIRCAVTDANSRVIQSNTIHFSVIHGVEEKTSIGNGHKVKSGQEEVLPKSFDLSNAFPNPFNPSTQLHFSLPEASVVKLTIFDVMGREMARVVDGYQSAGYHSISWHANNAAAGIYYVHFTAMDNSGKVALSKIQKLVLVK